MLPAKRPLSRRAALAKLARCAAAAATLPVSTFTPLTTAVAGQEPPAAPETPPEPPIETPPATAALGKDGLPDPAALMAKVNAEMAARAMDEEEGYGGWKHHIGKPEEAVCRVRVTVFEGGVSGAGQTTREGSGIIVRCDGFVLLPEALFGDDRELQKNAKISLHFRAADGPVPDEPLRPFSPPLYHAAKTDYVLVKVNGHHFKGLHLLDVRNLQVKMPVTVVWAAPAPLVKEGAKSNGATKKDRKESGAPIARTAEAVVGERVRDSSVPHFTLTFAPKEAAATTPATTPATVEENDLPPLGAAVIDPESGAVLGIVTVSTAKGVYFSPFGYFQWVSNDVGLKVSRDDIISPTPSSTSGVTTSGMPLTMVKVPGGPTKLNGASGDEYRFFYGTDVVCMPDFYIDDHPVTVGAYRSWLNEVGAPRQPLGWIVNNELRTHERNPDLPITGVIADDALRYAAGHKRRLPTPVEWARAGIGAKADWFVELYGEWVIITGEQNVLRQEKVTKYNEVMNARTRMQNKDYRTFKQPVAIADPEPILDEINDRQMKLYKTYWDKKGRWYPYQHSPVGFYKDDVSKWGVHEVVSNAPEECQPNYAVRYHESAGKPFATRVDPYLTQCSFYRWLANATPNDVDGNYYLFAALGEQHPFVYYENALFSLSTINLIGITGVSFRCAL